MDPSPRVDEPALVARAAAGDKSAQTALVRQHQAAVYRYLVRLTGDGSAAEDVLQDTFVTVLRELGTWRGQGSVRGWLYAVARSRVLMARRRKVDSATECADDVSLDALGAAAGWGAPDAELLAQRVEQRALLERALDTLPGDEREVVVLRDVEGLSGEETARVLELSVAAMKSRLHRGRLKLVAALRRQEDTSHGD